MEIVRGITSSMSEVISFRLDKKNHREAIAWQVLQEWLTKGYSIRFIMTESLMRLNDSNRVNSIENVLLDLNLKITELNQYLENLENSYEFLPVNDRQKSVKYTLKDKFITSVKKEVKLGLSLKS